MSYKLARRADGRLAGKATAVSPSGPAAQSNWPVRRAEESGSALNLNIDKTIFQEGWAGNVIYVGALLAIIGTCVALILLV